MYFTVVICTLVGLQLVSTQDCNDAETALASNNVCQEAFEAFDLNTTTAENALCTRPCRRLVRDMLFSCGLEFVSGSYRLRHKAQLTNYNFTCE